MKEKTLLIAVDLGTSLIKTGAYSLDGTCLAEASEPVKDERPAPGMFIQHGEELFESVVRCLAKTAQSLGDRAADVEAMAFTGQMAGFMGVDADWNDITTWSCSLDVRYMPYAVRQQQRLADKFMSISGTNSPLMSAKFEWFRDEFPEESKKIEKYLMISGYVIGKLGKLPIEDACIDGSFVTWTGMGDIKNKQWSDEICGDIGMDRRYLPKIVDSDAICGYLDAEIAKQTGLRAGIPLVSGAGDKVGGCVGAGILDFGDMILEAASYGAVSCMVKDFRPDNEEHYFDIITSAKRGSFYAHKYSQASGIIQDWFIDQMVKTDGLDRKASYRAIEAEAANLPAGSGGMMAIGLLGGRAIPLDTSLKGMFMGHTLMHTKAHFFRALLESHAYDLGISIDRIAAKYPEYKLDHVKIIGGGAKSAMLTQILADVTGRTFERLNRSDSALWGAAILAGSAIGAFPDMKETAHAHVAVKDVFRPDEKRYATYQKYKALYKEFIPELHSFYDRLAAIEED